jgi:translation initiation factor IF-2
MAKKRVHELAREYDMSSADVMTKLKAAGIEVKASASAVDAKEADAALRNNGRDAAAARQAAREAQKARQAAAAEAEGRQGDGKAAEGERKGRQQQRPNRGDLRGERAPSAGPGGRRRVVIDSQASRRQGPGGGGPPQGPPRRQRRGRRRRGTYNDTIAPLDTAAQSATDLVRINSGSTVKDVAEYFGVPVPEVIKKLMTRGEMATLTQTLSDDAIGVLAQEFGRQVEVVHAADEVEPEPEYEDADEDLVDRPPVVTIMGHVDHGKTSLLDAIRSTEVAGGEAGGITQHIGAYQVHHNDKLVTFLDTPGHQAFTAMRARGAQVTDIVVIVVAADDGVKPQTDEAIDHAKAAEVPIIVAVNKIDKEGADPTRVRTEMTQRALQPAEWGGETEFVDVSARTHDGLEDLLETIQVVAELEDYKANPAVEASGVVVESKLDPGRGPVVTLLVQRGTLTVGDALAAGSHWGRVRAMHDFLGARVKEALPGDPVEVLGFDGVPEAGETVRVVENDRRARQLAEERGLRLKQEQQARRSGRKRSLEDVFKSIQTGELQELALLVKADVAGSAEAIQDEIAKLPQDQISVNIIHTGVGGINESDVMLAAASEAFIIGFNVRPVGDARTVAEREGVDIRTYSVIYKALDELRAAMQGMLAPEEVEEALGSVEVRATFRASRIGVIAGSYVTDGRIVRGARTRLVRDGTVVYEGEIESLRRFNEDVREVATGFECGIVLRNFQDVKEGDVLEAFETRQVERALA